MESELSVRDILTTEYVGVSESDTVLGAVRLMRDERSSCVLVVRGSDPVGIMTEWDVLGVVGDESDPGETTVEAAMTTPVISVSPERSLTDVATMMARENIRNVVVETEDELLGVVTQRDVIAAAGSFQATTAPTRSNEGPAAIEPAIDDEMTPVDEPADDRIVPNGGDEYSTQGVCEACGSLADQLRDANGQLVCPDCRAV
ncbi:CBS domain-containing protein [Natrarchaeobaculum sulfurireducens]|uniref:CBS domain n=1 Tax=Natrarchaeobaculum sulfurireducens TaxID=2044521 RepID=A0A346PFL0_9EURY|nr:CBS domain-containing protein [Natrarchaeobaculum sulfurireducens]AXR78305.1 CBS domain [Natrarchaeobaculum sulfurireducens]AXR81664.1 CBS domain protein [Natrarchaeobaculum sulfurireducens]